MKTTGRAVVALLSPVLALFALTACGSKAPGQGATPSPTSPAPATATPTPSPSTAEPTTPAAPPTSTSPGTTVVLARVAYQWHWPNDTSHPGKVTHTYAVPPVPKLTAIGVGDHPRDPGERPFNRMSFTFSTAFPTYEFAFVNQLVSDGRGEPVPLEGLGVLKVTFRQAQAHSDDGTRSTIVSKPPAHLGLSRMVSYANAGDFEGVLTYGIGITWPNRHSNPQIAVRVYEVEKVNSHGQHVYVVAIDVDAR
jgi:hypothetical protein